MRDLRRLWTLRENRMKPSTGVVLIRKPFFQTFRNDTLLQTVEQRFLDILTHLCV